MTILEKGLPSFVLSVADLLANFCEDTWDPFYDSKLQKCENIKKLDAGGNLSFLYEGLLCLVSRRYDFYEIESGMGGKGRGD